MVLAVRKTFVFTKSRVEGTNIVLSPCAAQLPDGSIDHAGVVSEPSSVMIISELDDGGGCELLNVSMQDARKLAQALLRHFRDFARKWWPCGQFRLTTGARVGAVVGFVDGRRFQPSLRGSADRQL